MCLPAYAWGSQLWAHTHRAVLGEPLQWHGAYKDPPQPLRELKADIQRLQNTALNANHHSVGAAMLQGS